MATQVAGQAKSRKQIDSLLSLTQTVEDPKEQVDLAMEAVKYFVAYSIDSTLLLLDSLIAQYDQQGFNYGVARAKSLKSWHVCFKAQYEDGLRLAHEALDIQEAIADSSGAALTLMRLGITNLYFDRMAESEDYFLQALKRFERLADTALIDAVYNNLGVLFSEKNDQEKSVEFYKASLALRRKIPNYSYWIGYSRYNIAQSYLSANQLDSAGKYFASAEHTFVNDTRVKATPAMVDLGLSEYYQKIGNPEKAVAYAQRGLEKAELKKNDEMELDGQSILAEAQYQEGNYKQSYKHLKAYQELKNRIDSLSNAERVAEVELKYQTAKKEQDLAGLKAVVLEQELNAKKARVNLMWIASLAVLIFFVLLIWFLKRQQTQQLHAAQLEAGLAEVHLIALRAQMNPHFLFNCINTAQNFVLNADKQGAYEYLSKFASLLRTVLVNSGKNYVPIEDEIQQARLYIELEQVRFNEKFDFDLSVDPDLENGVYEIPAMVLQPFIENAILHGLVNKPAGTAGHLSVSLQLAGELIICKVKDNGVGRKKATEIKKQKATHYQSSAIPNIEERFRLLRKVSEKSLHFRILDIESAGVAQGTEVMLELPYQ